MSEEQACLVRARSDSETSSKRGSFGSISRTMTYTDGRVIDMLNPPPEATGEPAPNTNLPQDVHNTNDSNETGELIDYNHASVLAQFHEDALKQTGFGVSQLLVVLACGLAIAGATLELAVIPFILPSAEIELCILAHEKSWLVLITLVGASLGAMGWGALSSALGRRRTLVSCLAVNAVFSTIAAFMPTYGTFMMARFCSGIGSGGIIPTVFTYLAEFCQRSHRGRVLPILLIFMGTGGLYASGVAKAIVPVTGTDTLIENKEHFSAWHRYLLLCTLPILASLVSLIWTHESPRYLLEVGREVDAMVVYQNIHKSNQNKLCGKTENRTNNTGSEYRLGELELPGKRRPNSIHPVRHSVKMFWHSIFQLFSQTHRQTTFILGGTLFFSVVLLFTVSSYTTSYINYLQTVKFETSTQIFQNESYENVHFNKTLENVQFGHCTFVNCTFMDMFMSHVVFKNSTFVGVTFAAIKTSHTSFKGCYFYNSSILDTDLETSDLDEYCVLNGTSVRGSRVGCPRHADLTSDMTPALTQRHAYSAVTLLASPLALLPYSCRKPFAINVLCAVLSGAFYCAREEWALHSLEAIFRGLLALACYSTTVMIVETYPASLRCTGHGVVMSVCLAGACAGQVAGSSLGPASGAALACLLAGLAALLAMHAPNQRPPLT